MATQQQALLLDTIVSLKKAVKRKSYGKLQFGYSMLARHILTVFKRQNPTRTNLSNKTPIVDTNYKNEPVSSRKATLPLPWHRPLTRSLSSTAATSA